MDFGLYLLLHNYIFSTRISFSVIERDWGSFSIYITVHTRNIFCTWQQIVQVIFYNNTKNEWRSTTVYYNFPHIAVVVVVRVYSHNFFYFQPAHLPRFLCFPQGETGDRELFPCPASIFLSYSLYFPIIFFPFSYNIHSNFL